jgi:hypothetical protein
MDLVEDDERGGRPKSTRTEVNIVAVADLLKNDQQITPRIIVESLNIPKSVVLQILKEGSRKRKLCARFVPHSLTPEQREDGATSGQDIIAMADENTKFFNKILPEIRPGVMPVTPKQNVIVLNGLVKYPLGRRN